MRRSLTDFISLKLVVDGEINVCESREVLVLYPALPSERKVKAKSWLVFDSTSSSSTSSVKSIPYFSSCRFSMTVVYF